MKNIAPQMAGSVTRWTTVLQEAALELYTQFNCCVVFLGAELKEKYYKGLPSATYSALQDLPEGLDRAVSML